MSEDKGKKENTVPLKEGATIPTMRPVQSGNIEKKGAPIPNMQPVPSSGQEGGQTSDTSQTNQNKPSESGK